MVFVLRQTTIEERWPGVEKYVRVAFWGTNIGLFMMISMSLFPAGVLQIRDVVENGYWHARSLDHIGSPRALTIERLRLPGDLVFIVFGSVRLVIAAIKGYSGMRSGLRRSPGQRISHERRFDTALTVRERRECLVLCRFARVAGRRSTLAPTRIFCSGRCTRRIDTAAKASSVRPP